MHQNVLRYSPKEYMKKSSQVPAALIVAIAASLTGTGCGSGRTQQCVDAAGRVIPDAQCTSGRTMGAHWIPYVQRGGFGTSGSSFGG